jgi:hypothetical protein
MGYSVSLVLGAVGFISAYFIHDQYLLGVSFALIGCAWAAMLALPFALLTNALTGKSLGSYMGLFNCTICLPQIVASLVGIGIMALVGQEFFVNDLSYPKSPKIENSQLVSFENGAAKDVVEMDYNEELECYLADDVPTAMLADNFVVMANDGEEQYAINKDANKSEMAPNEAFSLKRAGDDVKVKGLKVVKRNEDGAIQPMTDVVDVYFYPGCDRLFVMENGEEFDEAKLMPKATSGQIKMLVVAGIALLIGAASVFGISTRRKEE